MATLNIKNFPDPLYKKLKARAKRQNRSVSQEVTRILATAVEEQEELSIWICKVWGKSCGLGSTLQNIWMKKGTRGSEECPG